MAVRATFSYAAAHICNAAHISISDNINNAAQCTSKTSVFTKSTKNPEKDPKVTLKTPTHFGVWGLHNTNG